METNRLGSSRDAKARASLETVIEFLKEQVSDMDSQMLELVRSNLELKTLDELLQSVPGVGTVLSATLLSSFPELGRDSRGCISSLVGFVPLNHDSDHAREVHFMVKKWFAPWSAIHSWWSWECAECAYTWAFFRRCVTIQCCE
jgi:Transposase IS116/IS110/IS902 family